jgi:hypothetical protein
MILNGSFEINTSPGNVYNPSNAVFNSYMSSVTAFGALAPGIDIQMTGSPYGSSPQSGNWKVSAAAAAGGQSDAFSFALSGFLNSGFSYNLEFYFERLTNSGYDGGTVKIGISSSAASFGTQVFATSPASLGWTLAKTTFVAPHSANFLTVQVDNAGNHWVGLDNFTLDPAPLLADYNGDGAVDAADYVVWRANVGAATLNNRDSNGMGPVGQADYDFWRMHFGETAGSGASASVNASVPEPVTLVLLMFAATGWGFQRRRAT